LPNAQHANAATLAHEHANTPNTAIELSASANTSIIVTFQPAGKTA